jgi:hypothetical protein
MIFDSSLKSALIAVSLLALSACGGGGGSDSTSGGGPTSPAPVANSPPVADAGPNQNVVTNTKVDLDGTRSSDPDGDALSYSWIQIGTPAVTLAGADTETPSFTSPDVAPGATISLQFELTVGDGTDTATDTVDVTVSATLPAVNISGKLFYEQPQANSFCRHRQ